MVRLRARPFIATSIAARGLTGAVAVLTLMRIGAAPVFAAPAKGDARVWVSAEDAGEVAAIDPVKGEVTVRVKVGPRPRGLKLSPDGKLLYVTVSGTPKPGPHGIVPPITPAARAADGVAVVDVAGGTLLRTLRAGQAPIAIDLSPNGKTAYVANGETAEVTVLDLGSGSIKKKIPVGQEPAGVAVRPDGKVVYVVTTATNEVYAIDTAKLELVVRVDAGVGPRSVIFSRDGATAFVIDEQVPEITFLDAKKHLMLGHLVVAEQVKTIFVPRPFAAVLSPAGNTLFVSSGLGGSILVVDVVKRRVVSAIDEVGQAPRGIAIGRDGKKLFSANGPSNDVSIVDVASGKVEKRVRVGGAPWGVVAAPGI